MAWPLLNRVFGPRVPRGGLLRHPLRYLLPTALLLSAAALLAASSFLPYWRMTLRAPQYPKGLTVVGYVDRLTGDMQEIDGLNHYIGMRPLHEAAQIERRVGLASIYVFAALLILASLVHRFWAVLLALPAMLFPAGFLADLAFWLWKFGNHLDPHAPLSSSIKPFTPPVLGMGRVGQFRTIASADQGLILAAVASGLIIAGLLLQRRAFKPLLQRREPAPQPPGPASHNAEVS